MIGLSPENKEGLVVNQMRCPGCGCGYNGRRCAGCGYEPFGETGTVQKDFSTAPVPKRERKKHPLIRFLILLYLIYLLLPFFRQWGLKLEAMEEAARETRSSYQTEAVPQG